MENRLDISHGNGITKKSKSLDIKSLYKSKVVPKEAGNNGSKKRKVSTEDGDDKKNKKKSRKEMSISSINNVSSSSKKSSGDGWLSVAPNGLEDPKVSPKLNSSTSWLKGGSHTIHDSIVLIPKRKRDFVGRKKVLGNQVVKPVAKLSSKVGSDNQISKSFGHELDDQVNLSEIKVQRGFDNLMENKEGQSNSVSKDGNECTSDVNVNNSDIPPKKKKNSRKRKRVAPESKLSAKEAKPVVDNSSIRPCEDSQGDDEENLEENAARMLSLRFDPSCTGFSANSKTPASPSMSELPFLSSSSRNFGSLGFKSFSTSKSASVDSANRVLRPRKQHKEKNHTRKRRHFYEIFSGDMDAYWVLNRRIKVFWPLDQSWYYGLVNDYDKERELHHVKYDDRDEEWINLQNERFKLLLLPSEVPGKTKTSRRKSVTKSKSPKKGKLKTHKDKEKIDLTPENDSYISSSMDSEPIISWLVRSSRRVKSSASRAGKKQKIHNLGPNSGLPMLSDEARNVHGYSDVGSPRLEEGLSSSNLALLADVRNCEKNPWESITCTKDGKHPIVYVRGRLHKTGEAMPHSSKGSSLSTIACGPVKIFSPVFEGLKALEENDMSLIKLDADVPLLRTDEGLLRLTFPRLEDKKFQFDLSLPLFSFLNCSFGAENLWLFRALLLLQCGAVVTVWPKIYLEMLFVDNIVGLRFMLFEGCWKQVVAFVFLVLMVFHQPNVQGKYLDLQLPITSMRFKISSVQDPRKQLVFAFYNFSELKNSKWMYLDRKLKKHCYLTKELPLSDCTYTNIKALQNGTNHSLTSSIPRGCRSVKGLQKRFRQGLTCVGISNYVGVNASRSSSNSLGKFRELSPLALSFNAAPSFFLGLHLRLLMEHSVSKSFQDQDTVEYPGISAEENDNVDWSIVSSASSDAACNRLFFGAKPGLKAGVMDVCSNGDVTAEVSVRTQVSEEDRNDVAVAAVQLQRNVPHPSESELHILLQRSLNNDISIEIPALNRFEKSVDKVLHGVQHSADLACHINDGIIHSPNPTAPRSTWNRNRNSSSSTFRYLSNGWVDGNSDLQNGFRNGSKKAQTQVSAYSMPYGGLDFSPKHRSHSRKTTSHKRIRTSEKRSSDVSRGFEKNLELLSCDANILITCGDKGWRESGAHVISELVDRNEWRLAVKLAGTIKFSYKAHQFLQPGSTNRYTHSMMWKGGKDWILEFPDRSQWALFKEMYEECYNRNMRAALVKNIPIPGVRLIDESNENTTDITFIRSSSKYFRQVLTDVEMALDPSTVLYDMDTDDEQWIIEKHSTSGLGASSLGDVSEMFEKVMDMFEKAAYTQQRDQFTADEMEELMAGSGSMEVITSIYEHWRQKRQSKGMSLIRHFQPPLWERYQQQVKAWELAMNKTTGTIFNGGQEKAVPAEKPPMFAFCLKPRGLEVPNKGSKHRSHRRFSLAGQSTILDPDGFHYFGRRLNGYSFGDAKIMYPSQNYDSMDDSPLSLSSPRFPSRDRGNMEYFWTSSYGFDRNYQLKLHKNKSRRYVGCHDSQMASFYNPRSISKPGGHRRSSIALPEWSSQYHYQYEVSRMHAMEQLDGSDLEEFRLRDASGASQHAVNMAKLKREKAQRLLYRADLAIHKAVVALMTAEAIKAASEDSNDNEYNVHTT